MTPATTSLAPPPPPATGLEIGGLLGAPIQVAAPRRDAPPPAQRLRRRVAVIVPCYNRPADLALLLSDLARIDAPADGVDLRIVAVDNASEQPLDVLPVPDGLDALFLRLPTNTGGSGGFNAGMAHALGEMTRDGRPWSPELLWLVDSDARVLPGTLRGLLSAMDRDPGLVVAGSAIAAPPFPTGRIFEIGGRVNRRNGRYEPEARGPAGLRGPIPCDYVAACSAMVRASAVRRAGLMPDVFLNGDDVEWCIRLAQATGGRIAGVPDSVAFHPTFDRFPTLPRYYVARNAFGPIDALGLGATARLRRALREVARAVGQAMMGRDDLAALHIRGLRDAARGPMLGPAPAGSLAFDPFRPLKDLPAALAELPISRTRPTRVGVAPDLGVPGAECETIRRAIAAAGLDGNVVPYEGSAHPLRVAARVFGVSRRPLPDVAVIPARGRPGTWFAARTLVQVVPGGFIVRRTSPLRTLLSAARTAGAGTFHALRVAARGRRITPMRAAPSEPIPTGRASAAATTDLSIIILSHNRWSALRRTVEHLAGPCAIPRSAILIVDNASTDGTPERAAEMLPGVRLLRAGGNLGVEAFNRGVSATSTGLVLILDDDARPDPAALHSAADLLASRPDLAAVTLHPRHPETGVSEWPFAAAAARGDDRWPVMGCANIVRRAAWDRVGGYEGGYFLYRNDTDLALKLLADGQGVHFRPDWVVWHDSPAAARKSPRWHRLATRNWIWTARRHGRGVGAAGGVLLGWLWAHRLARLCPRRHWCTFRGALDAFAAKPPPTSGGCPARSSRSFCRLLRLQLIPKTGGILKTGLKPPADMVR